jgi:hypothetical protein
MICSFGRARPSSCGKKRHEKENAGAKQLPGVARFY